jgi:hypothetical protein
MSALPPNLRARILDAAKREPAPTRAVQTKRALLAGVAGACLSIVISAATGGPTHQRRAFIVALVGIGAALMAVVATWVAGARGTSMLGRSRSTLVAIAVAAPVAILAWSLFASSVEGTAPIAGESMRAHAVCFAFTLFFAAGPFAALAYARRASDPVHPRALGAALGGAAGAWGGMFIDVHCAFTSAAHFTLGHAAPIALLAATGALLGARLFGVRAKD